MTGVCAYSRRGIYITGKCEGKEGEVGECWDRLLHLKMRGMVGGEKEKIGEKPFFFLAVKENLSLSFKVTGFAQV